MRRTCVGRFPEGVAVPHPERALVGEHLDRPAECTGEPQHRHDGAQAALPRRLQRLRGQRDQGAGVGGPQGLEDRGVEHVSLGAVARRGVQCQAMRQVAAGQQSPAQAVVE